MSSRCPDPRGRRRAIPAAMLLLLAACAAGGESAAADTAAVADARRPALRVCADPNNLPFSNERREGFENAIVEVIGAELGLPVEYTWFAQRRGFVRNTLRAGECDVIPGIVASSELVLTTRPYYRSTYMFVTRRDAASAVARIASLDDPALRRLRIGVHVVGDDYTNTPPAHALANRGIIRNVRGYTLYGDYSQPDPPLALVRAVADGELDVAIAWGPFAGWMVRQGAPLALRPVTPEIDLPFLPLVYDIAMGVRRGDDSLRVRLDAALERRRPEILVILERWGVPLAGGVVPGATASAAHAPGATP